MTSTHRSPSDSTASATASTSASTSPSPAADDRSLWVDIMAFTPAATLGRELLALIVNLGLVGLIVVVLQPRPIVAVVMLAAVSLFMLGRLVAGFRTRGYGRALTGGR